jgi:hypothetical protein
MRIIDIYGQPARIYSFKSLKGMNHYTIDLNDLSNGVYLIQLTGSEQKHSGKLLINK